MLSNLMRRASKLKHIPIVDRAAPPRVDPKNKRDLQAFLKAQTLAEQGAKEIATYIQDGWNERQAADMLNTWLRDHGVGGFFHYSYAWFGERTRFTGINRRKYLEFMPTSRIIQPGEPFILDTAPIYQGYMCDIGYSGCLGENKKWQQCQTFLTKIRSNIVDMFKTHNTGSSIWKQVDEEIAEAGFDNIHSLYPFSVLGHRVYRCQNQDHGVRMANFGWQSYWSILSKGIFNQLLNPEFEGDLRGLWAVEPHIGLEEVGAKFEEILVVESKDKVYWLKDRQQLK